MNDIVLRVAGLSKRYHIGERRVRYRTVREAIATAVTAPFRRSQAANAGEREAGNTIWALNDVSFDVHRGEVVGVIGRNGAGKSTLLKILSRITEPTSGFADVTGRVASLLEVGTGFHLELTGRENVILNAAILGMSRHDVQRKFDQIVEFADVARFIDTPVKHYSSGMHLRLAFSVAAHLEPEILLIDEILAVGDVEFQKKCLGKMEDVASQGRTVLFVSHNLGVVRELCHSAAVLDRGRLVFRGSVLDGLTRYSEAVSRAPAATTGTGDAWQAVQVSGDTASAVVASLTPGERLTLDGWLAIGDDPPDGGTLICIIEDSVGNTIVHQRAIAPDGWESPLTRGRFRVQVEFPALWLSPGAYTAYFKFMAKRGGAFERVISERVLLDVTGSRAGVGRAILAPRLRWAVRHEADQNTDCLPEAVPQ